MLTNRNPVKPSPSIKDIFGNLPTLTTERLTLRKMRSEDAHDMFEYARLPEVSRYTVWGPHRSMDETRLFLQCVTTNYERGEIENWGIEYTLNGKFIGTAGYFFWDETHHRAEIHYALSPRYAGQGLMSEAVERIIRFGFENMGLNRIEAKCMPDNTASERVMQKAGMIFEGIMRQGVLAKGSYHDLKCYAVLKQDWEHRGGTR